MKKYLIFNYLGYEVGDVEVLDESYLNPIRAYASKISIPESRVSGSDLIDAGYKFALAPVEPKRPKHGQMVVIMKQDGFRVIAWYSTETNTFREIEAGQTIHYPLMDVIEWWDITVGTGNKI